MGFARDPRDTHIYELQKLFGNDCIVETITSASATQIAERVRQINAIAVVFDVQRPELVQQVAIELPTIPTYGTSRRSIDAAPTAPSHFYTYERHDEHGLVTPVRQENEQERRHRLDRDNDLQREHWLEEQRQRELGEERGRDGDDIDNGY